MSTQRNVEFEFCLLFAAFATGFAKCGVPMGMFVMPPITHFVLATFGWRGVFGMFVGLQFLLIFVALTIPPLPGI